MVTLPMALDGPDGITTGLEEIERDVRALQHALADVRGTAESDDGLIQATAGGRGELIELQLDPRIYRVQDSTALAADITAAIRTAATRARDQVLSQAARLLPATIDPATADVEFDPFLTEIARLKGRATP